MVPILNIKKHVVQLINVVTFNEKIIMLEFNFID